jgi:hypothetical protein
MADSVMRALQTVTLRNGAQVRLREQTDGDRVVLALLFEGLSERSRYLLRITARR